MVYKFFDKKTAVGAVKNGNISNKELAEELHKRIIRKFKEKTSIRTFYRKYLGCWSCWYAINK